MAKGMKLARGAFGKMLGRGMKKSKMERALKKKHR